MFQIICKDNRQWVEFTGITKSNKTIDHLYKVSYIVVVMKSVAELNFYGFRKKTWAEFTGITKSNKTRDHLVKSELNSLV